MGDVQAEPTPWRGLGYAALGYGLLSSQDAIVKWLVTEYAVPQILFMRSVLIVAGCLAVTWLGKAPSILRSPHKGALLLRAAIVLTAWFCYFTAARQLPLAQLTAIYFAAPIICVVMSILVLKERVGRAKWLAVLTGFAGVLVAINPGAAVAWAPACLVLVAAGCWGTASVLIRKTSATESTLNQMLAGSLVFMAACAVMLPTVWITPSAGALMLMLSLGVVSGLGQWALYESFRFAPASSVAPAEYTMLLWATVYGYLIWHDVPTAHTLLGAALIVAAGFWLLRTRARASASAG